MHQICYQLYNKGNLGAIDEYEGIGLSKEKRNATLPGWTRQTENITGQGEGDIRGI